MKFPVAWITSVLLVSAVLSASFSGPDVYLPAVGSGPGAENSNWSSTVWVHNPGTASASVTYHLLEWGKPNPSPASFGDTIAAGQTKIYENPVQTMFSKTGFGALRVTANRNLLVNSRVYSTPSGGAAKDSVGQFLAAFPASFAIGAGEKTQLLGVHQTAPAADSQFRFNFGCVETTGSGATVRMTLLNAAGQVLKTKDYPLGGREAWQKAVTDIDPAVNGDNLRLQGEVIAGNGKVLFYGSRAANESNDACTFEMMFKDSLLGGGTGGDITAVVAGTGLTGGGDSGDVTLSVAVPLELTGTGSKAILAYPDIGVFGTGVAGGYFVSGAGSPESAAYVAWQGIGISAAGIETGGRFTGGAHGRNQVSAGANDAGLIASSESVAGIFEVNGGAWSEARLADGKQGIVARGADTAGYFELINGNARATLASVATGGVFYGNDAGVWGSNTTGVWGSVARFGATIEGNGTKSFVQNHPDRSDRVVVFYALEGDEAGTYTRGTGRLAGGEARIPLPEPFAAVTHPEEGLTAHLTPRGDCEGLYVASLTTKELVVRELRGGTGGAAFDYIVHGLREGFEEVPVMRPKTEEAPIPSRERTEATYREHPELKRLTPLERFKAMAEAGTGE